MASEKNSGRPAELKNLSLKIAVPIIIGLGVIYFLFCKDFSPEAFHFLKWTESTALGLAGVIAAFFARELGMAWRFNVLTDGKLSMGKSLYTTFLCEFTSAITPSSVGGSALSMIFMNREGISLGRATTYTLIILMLDNLFFTLVVPVLLLFYSPAAIFDFGQKGLERGMETVFWCAYGAMAAFALVLATGVLVAPSVIGKLAQGIGRLRLFKKWQKKLDDFSQNLQVASVEVKSRNIGWWLRAFIATALSWTGRFMVVNAIFYAVLPSTPQATVFVRQIVVWALLMFTPTPGGSGLSEWLFDKYYADIIPQAPLVMIIALLWRIFSYYVYLIVGVILIPSFIRSKK